MGYLIELIEHDKKIQTGCAAEPVETFLRKNGLEEKTIGKMCLCNGLSATIGLAMPGEKPVIAAGGDLTAIINIVNKYCKSYSAKNVIDYILEK